MDDLDRQLIAALRNDARAPIARLADLLGVSRGTITNRMARLEQDGVITGYTLRLRPDATPDQIHAWTAVTLQGNQRPVVQALLGEPDVVALHDTNGRWDLLAELRVVDLDALSRTLERIRRIPGIVTTETSVHLRSFHG